MTRLRSSHPSNLGHGRPSDHSVAIARPNVDAAMRTGFSRSEKRTRRAVLASGVALLGLFLACHDWTNLHNLQGVDAKLEYVNHTLLTAQDHYCPLETYTVRLGRHPHVSARLARLSKLKANEFKKHRYSHRFKQLKKECKEELKNIKQKRIQFCCR